VKLQSFVEIIEKRTEEPEMEKVGGKALQFLVFLGETFAQSKTHFGLICVMEIEILDLLPTLI
jgi:hypothetical protein